MAKGTLKRAQAGLADALRKMNTRDYFPLVAVQGVTERLTLRRVSGYLGTEGVLVDVTGVTEQLVDGDVIRVWPQPNKAGIYKYHSFVKHDGENLAGNVFVSSVLTNGVTAPHGFSVEVFDAINQPGEGHQTKWEWSQGTQSWLIHAADDGAAASFGVQKGDVNLASGYNFKRDGKSAVIADIFDANTILKADSNDTPVALTVDEDRLVGRLTGGSIAALTPAQVGTMLGASGVGNLLLVKNMCGSTAAANEVGYLDADRQYKRTATAGKEQDLPCVVIVGGIYFADIYVQISGTVSAKYVGAAPAAGDDLAFSTTAGSVKVAGAGEFVIAVAKSAGAGGTVAAVIVPTVTDVVRGRDFAAKGDLLVGTGAGTFAALAVGNDGQRPEANSSEPTGWTLSDQILVGTLGAILAASPTIPRLAYATDVERFYIADGSDWRQGGLELKVQNAPDLGAYAATSRLGYEATYILEKVLYSIVIGLWTKPEDVEGGIQVEDGEFQIYLNGAWNPIVINFRFREDDDEQYEFEHQPIGFERWIEVFSGNSEELGANGFPLVQQYKTCIGAMPPRMVVDGGTF